MCVYNKQTKEKRETNGLSPIVIISALRRYNEAKTCMGFVRLLDPRQHDRLITLLLGKEVAGKPLNPFRPPSRKQASYCIELKYRYECSQCARPLTAANLAPTVADTLSSSAVTSTLSSTSTAATSSSSAISIPSRFPDATPASSSASTTTSSSAATTSTASSPIRALMFAPLPPAHHARKPILKSPRNPNRKPSTWPPACSRRVERRLNVSASCIRR